MGTELHLNDIFFKNGIATEYSVTRLVHEDTSHRSPGGRRQNDGGGSEGGSRPKGGRGDEEPGVSSEERDEGRSHLPPQ